MTLVQQARLRQDSESADESEGGGGDAGRAARTQGDGGELEVDDVNVQDPIAALSKLPTVCWSLRVLVLLWLKRNMCVCVAVRLESGRSWVRIPLAPGFFRGRVIPVT